jgi:hypothetical protein
MYKIYDTVDLKDLLGRMALLALAKRRGRKEVFNVGEKLLFLGIVSYRPEYH